METLLTICQIFFLIMGIWGVIASSVSSFLSMKVAAAIYFMSAVIFYHSGSWIPLVLGFLALLGMRYFGFEPSGEEARKDALEQLSLEDSSTNISLRKDGKSSPQKQQPSQKTLWDGIRASGVSQPKIKEAILSSPQVTSIKSVTKSPFVPTKTSPEIDHKKDIRDLAKSCDIEVSMADGNYRAFIIHTSVTNEEFASSLKESDGKQALAGFIAKIDDKINAGEFNDPLKMVEEMFGADPHLKKNLLAQRMVVSKDNKVLFNWTPDPSVKPRKQPTQQEFWDDARKRGVDINALVRSMPTIPPSDHHRLEEEIVAGIKYSSECDGSTIFYEVVLPLLKNKFVLLFRDYHQYQEYVNLMDLIEVAIDPDLWTSMSPPALGAFYRLFDQDRQYLFSWSNEKKVHFEVDPVPEVKFCQLECDNNFTLDSFQKDMLRSLLVTTDKREEEAARLEQMQVAVRTHIGLYSQEGDEEGAKIFLSLQPIVNSAKSIHDLEKLIK